MQRNIRTDKLKFSEVDDMKNMMKVFIKAYDRKTGEKINISDDDRYRLSVTEKGMLYITSLTEKDEDGYDKELDVKFEIVAR